MVTCEGCGKTITKVADLNVVLLSLIFLKKFCNACFSKRVKKFFWTHPDIYLSLWKINGTSEFATLIVMTIVGLLAYYFLFTKITGNEPVDPTVVWSILLGSAFVIWLWIRYFQGRQIEAEVRGQRSKETNHS